MIETFKAFGRPNKHGGKDHVEYVDMTLEEIDQTLSTCAYQGQIAYELPAEVYAGSPKKHQEHRAKLCAIYQEQVEYVKAMHKYSVEQASHWFDIWRREAIESGRPDDAPVNKNEVKDRCRNLRRQMTADFKPEKCVVGALEIHRSAGNIGFLRFLAA